MAPIDTLIARVPLNLAAFAGMGVDLPNPLSVSTSAPFFGWPACEIETKQFLDDPSNPIVIMCAKPGAPWSPGLDSLLIDDPLWLYIDSGAPLPAATAASLARQMKSWPTDMTPDLGDIPEVALRAVGKLSLSSLPALAGLAQALGLDQSQQVTASVDFPGGFPRVVVWAERASLGNVIKPARVEFGSILGPSDERLQVRLSGSIPLGGEGTIELNADVPLDGGTIVASGSFKAGAQSTLTQILPLYRSADVELDAGIELTAAPGVLTLDSVTLAVQVSGASLIPNLLTIDAGAAITIVDPLGEKLSMATVSGRATFGKPSDGLAFDVSGSYPSGQFQFSLAPGTTLDVAAMLKTFGVSNPPTPLAITTASAMYYSPAKYLSATVGATCDFAIGPLHLTSVAFGIKGIQPQYVVSIDATAALGPIAFAINAIYDPAHGWSLAASARSEASIAQLLNAMHLPDSSIASLPEFLRDLTIDELSAAATDDTADFSCELTVEGIDVIVGLHITKEPAGWKLSSATLTIARQTFAIDLASPDAATRIVASYVPASAADALSIGQIASALHIPTPDVLTRVLGTAKIRSARLVIDKPASGPSAFSVAATIDTTSVAILRVTPPGAPASTFAAASLDVGIGLASLPLIGGMIGAAENLGVKHLDVILGAPKKADLARLALAFAPGSQVPTFPDADVTSSIALAVTLQLGAVPMLPLMLAAEADHFAPPADALPPAAPAPPAASGGTWLNVQRSFGPINIRRIGLSFPDGDLWLMLEAGFMIAGVDLELEGLALRFTPALPPIPKTPVLRGIAVGFDGGGVSLSGGLLAVPQPGGGTEYDGQIMLEGASFQLTALGSYAPGPSGASLFGYVILDRPLGGPPFFYVTAIAAGFGFNRTLNIPTIQNVPQFALVQAATGNAPFGNNNIAGALTVMQKDVPIQYGENWLALGVRFTTFKLLDSFALAYAKFGTDLEIGLLGQSTMTVPTNAPNPIGKAQLALEASFRPNEGVLSICGQLTPASYVLSPDCHLTGGFAYMAWFKDVGDVGKGPRAGDFVLTLGGYHPSFKRQPWYPIEPRVGANWQVTPNLLVKSELYFALTPSSVMAGGSLNATWQSGDLKAWFTLAADFLLCWKPFYYEAEVAVNLGASYRVDLWLTSFTVTVSVGVDIHFWGPPFAGTAKVDLYVLSFTIRFGSSNAAPAPIDWNDFKQSFLPHDGAQTLTGLRAAVGAPPAATPTESLCFTRVSGGLVKDLRAAGGGDVDWVINPETLELVTSSVIPITDATIVLGTGAVQTIDGKGSIWKNNFGIGPVGVANGDLHSTLAITLTRTDGNLPPERFHFAPPQAVIDHIPSATWSKAVALTPGLSQTNAVPVITDVLTGFIFKPKPIVLTTTLPIDLEALKYSDAPTSVDFTTPAPKVEDDNLDQSTALDTFMKTLTGAQTTRLKVLQNLAGQGLRVATTVDVTASAKSADTVLLGAPALARLGAEKGRAA